jgi:hypothetical protein
MPWIAAHAVLYVRYKDGPQTDYPVCENIYLIESSGPHDALELATHRARQEEGDSNGTFTWNDRPAEWVFAGIRKLIAVTGVQSGDEITYSEMVLKSLDDVRRFGNGQAVDVKGYE